VRASTNEAVSVGVTGVPAWVIDGKLLIPGAQPREIFEQAFAQLAE
jgi:predicted DsbA family dithiol-disulfide isomerase